MGLLFLVIFQIYLYYLDDLLIVTAFIHITLKGTGRLILIYSRKTFTVGIICLLFIGFFIFYHLQKPVQTPPQKNKHSVVKKKEYIPVVEYNGGSHLKEIGQKVRQKNWGTLTLVDRIKVNNTFTVSPMVIKVNDVKIIRLSNLTKQTKEFLRGYTGLSNEEAYQLFTEKNLSNEEIQDRVELSRTEIGNNTTYLEITYSVKNTGSKELQFFSIENVKLNHKWSYKVPEENFILSDDTLIGAKSVSRVDYRPGESRKGTIGLLNVSDSSIRKITSFSFTTDDLLDGDSHHLLAKPKTFTINF